MKTLALLFACLIAAALHAATLTLSWTYPGPITPDLGFVVLESTNLAAPLTNWNTLTNVAATNTVGSNFFQQVSVAPAQYFFVIEPSNAWGLGAGQTSNIASTPPVAVPPTNLSITISK